MLARSNCKGVNNINIPCSCPPDRASFIAQLNQNVNAGFVINNPSVKGVTFPTDDSKASKLARLFTATVTLQNLHGPGVGCPQAATTFGAQQAAIEAGTDTPAAPSAPAAPAAPAEPAAPASGGVDTSLVPDFGVVAGTSPDGTGNCKGINNINIPCSCPPARDEFIAVRPPRLPSPSPFPSLPSAPSSSSSCRVA